LLFDELDDVVGGSDKINPSLLISSATDFTNYEFFQASDTPQSLEPSSDFDGPTTSENEKENVNHRNGRTHNPKKRKNMDGLLEILGRKWEEDKEERIEREKREEERTERSERRANDLLNIMRSAADALARIAELS